MEIEFTRNELANEEWRDIVGYEGKYQISSLGRLSMYGVYRDGRKYASRIKKTRLDTGGYEYAILTDFSGKTKTWKIHRLVAITFIPNPNKYPCVDHIDGDRRNNRTVNLRWATYSMNANNPITRDRLSKALKRYCSQDFVRERHRENALKPQNMQARRTKIIRTVYRLDKNGSFIKEFKSITEAANSVNGNVTSITRACRNRRPTAYGYKWKYKEDYESSNN